jgi:MFS family permease
MSVIAAGPYSSRWGRLIPIAFITYSLAYVDRANYSFGAAGGMAHDLNINAAASSLLGALFFLGYFFFQVPAAYYAEKRSVKELIFWSLILWGIFAAATGLLTDIGLLYVDRFLLGVMESVVLPGMLIFLSHWFTKAERSRANTFLILGNPITVLWMSIVSGYLVQAFGWRGMFIIEGAPPIIWAFVWRAMVEDWPHQAAWLDPNERVELERKLEDEQRQFKPVKDYAAAFRTPMVITLAIQYFCWSVGVYGFVIWLPSMLKAAGETSIVLVGWLSAGPYLAAAALMVIGSYFSDVSGNRKNFVWPFLLIGGSGILWVLPTGNIELLARLRAARGCGGHDVCTVRPVLRLDIRDAAPQRGGRRDRADKLLRRAWIVRGIVLRRVAQRSNGWFGRIIPVHGSCSAGIGGPHSDAAESWPLRNTLSSWDIVQLRKI